MKSRHSNPGRHHTFPTWARMSLRRFRSFCSFGFDLQIHMHTYLYLIHADTYTYLHIPTKFKLGLLSIQLRIMHGQYQCCSTCLWIRTNKGFVRSVRLGWMKYVKSRQMCTLSPIWAGYGRVHGSSMGREGQSLLASLDSPCTMLSPHDISQWPAILCWM